MCLLFYFAADCFYGILYSHMTSRINKNVCMYVTNVLLIEWSKKIQIQAGKLKTSENECRRKRRKYKFSTFNWIFLGCYRRNSSVFSTRLRVTYQRCELVYVGETQLLRFVSVVLALNRNLFMRKDKRL